jgi:hypothetical protein
VIERLVAHNAVPARAKFSPRYPRTPLARETRPRTSPTLDRKELNGVQKNTIVLKKPRPIEAPAIPLAIGESFRVPAGGAVAGVEACSKIFPPPWRTERSPQDNEATDCCGEQQWSSIHAGLGQGVRPVLWQRLQTSSVLSDLEESCI